MKIAVAVLSLSVLAATGIVWVGAGRLDGAFHRANVIHSSTVGDQNILLVGLDSRYDANGDPLPPDVLQALHAGVSSDGGDNTDTIIVVHLSADGRSATAFSIPRDSYVSIPGCGTHKINGAFTDGAGSVRSAPQNAGGGGPTLNQQADAGGAATTIATVQALTGLPITHYVAVNLAGFAALSSAVGGVPVCLAAPVNDPYSGAAFPAGPQQLSGAQALAFVRQRHGLHQGDLDRIRRQQVFLASSARTVLSAGTLADPTKLSALLGVVNHSITLDQGWNAVDLAVQLQPLAAKNMRFETIPIVRPDLHTGTDGQAVQVDPLQVQAFVRTAIGPRSPSAAPAAPAPVTVDVLNASGATGLATAAMAALTRDGLLGGRVGNVPSARTSSIRFSPGRGRRRRDGGPRPRYPDRPDPRSARRPGSCRGHPRNGLDLVAPARHADPTDVGTASASHRGHGALHQLSLDRAAGCLRARFRPPARGVRPTSGKLGSAQVRGAQRGHVGYPPGVEGGER